MKKDKQQNELNKNLAHSQSNEADNNSASFSNESEEIKITGIMNAADLYKMDITKLPYLVDKIIPKVGVVTIAGSSDVGKSTLARQIAIAISSKKKKWCNFTLNPEHHKVIYASTEDDQLAVSYLLNKRNYSEVELQGITYIFDCDNLEKQLESLLKEQPVDLIIIDVWTDLYSGEMNATNRVRNYINEYRTLALNYRCAIIFIHHTGKNKDNELPSKNNLNGSQGFEGKMRVVIELRKDGNDKAIRHLCIVKGNYLDESEKNKSFVLKMDNNMTLNNTGERRNFGELKTTESEKSQLQDAVAEIYKTGITACRSISEELSKRKLKAGKDKVQEILKKLNLDQNESDESELNTK